MGFLRSQVIHLVADDRTAGLIHIAGWPVRSRGIGLGGLRQRGCLFLRGGLGRSRGRGAGAVATTSGFAASRLAAGRFAAGRFAAALLLAAEQTIEQVEDRRAALLAAGSAGRLAASGLAAVLRFAASGLAAVLRFAASGLAAVLRLTAGRFGAARGLFAAASRLAAAFAATLALEQTLQAAKQVADGPAARLAASGLASGLTASRIATSGFRRAALDRWITTGRFAAGRFATAATSVQPQQVVQEFEAEPLAAQGGAQDERHKKHSSFHRATSPIQGTGVALLPTRRPPICGA